MAMLRSNGIDPAGKRTVVIGRSILVGQPMALMLQAANATVTIAHSRTADLACLLYTSPSPRDYAASRMPSSA